MQKDDNNYLIQLADYTAGVINRYQQGKKCADEYRRFIAHKEIYVQVWPK